MKKIENLLKAAVPVALGVALFAVVVKYAAEWDVPFIKDLRDAFDS